MIGIIIAGGKGTRLLPLTQNRPKHLLPLANRPFLEYQISLMRSHGIREIVFATNYFAAMIEDRFGDGSEFGVRLRYAVESEPLGTGGAIRNAWDLMPDQSVIVLNGDILTDFDLSSVIEEHSVRVKTDSAVGSVILRTVDRPHAFGVIETDANDRMISWREPSEEEKRATSAMPGDRDGSDSINAGIYLLEPAFLKRIPEGRPSSVEREVFPEALRTGAALYCASPRGSWLDLGSPQAFSTAATMVTEGGIQTDVRFQAVAPDSSIAEDAEVPGSTIGSGVVIGRESRVAGSIILDGVQIGARVNLIGTIADEGVVIEDDVLLRVPIILSAGSRIARGTIL